MATQRPSWYKESANKSYSHLNSDYDNFDLNLTYGGNPSSNVFPVQSQSTSNNRQRDFGVENQENFHNTTFGSYISALEKQNQTQHESYHDTTSEEQKDENPWKRDSNANSILNKSTLSLHITAYENGNGVPNTVSQNPRPNISFGPGLKEKKKLNLPFANVQHPHEPLRQMPTESVPPETVQFKTSEKVFNPNATSMNSTNSGKPIPLPRANRTFIIRDNANAVDASSNPLSNADASKNWLPSDPVAAYSYPADSERSSLPAYSDRTESSINGYVSSDERSVTANPDDFLHGFEEAKSNAEDGSIDDDGDSTIKNFNDSTLNDTLNAQDLNAYELMKRHQLGGKNPLLFDKSQFLCDQEALDLIYYQPIPSPRNSQHDMQQQQPELGGYEDQSQQQQNYYDHEVGRQQHNNYEVQQQPQHDQSQHYNYEAQQRIGYGYQVQQQPQQDYDVHSQNYGYETQKQPRQDYNVKQQSQQNYSYEAQHETFNAAQHYDQNYHYDAHQQQQPYEYDVHQHQQNFHYDANHQQQQPYQNGLVELGQDGEASQQVTEDEYGFHGAAVQYDEESHHYMSEQDQEIFEHPSQFDSSSATYQVPFNHDIREETFQVPDDSQSLQQSQMSVQRPRGELKFAPSKRRPTCVIVEDDIVTKLYEFLPYEESHQILPPYTVIGGYDEKAQAPN